MNVECSWPVLRQLLAPGPYQDGINFVHTGLPAYRLAVVKRFQRNSELVGGRVSPPLLDHRSSSPQAG